MATSASLVRDQRDHIDGAEIAIGHRQRRIMQRALRQLRTDIDRVELGAWGHDVRRQAMVTIAQALRQATEHQILDMGIGLTEVTKRSTKDAATWLATHDRQYRGRADPLRFDTMTWWSRHDKRLGKVRLRQYRKSFRRYGAGAVAEIEDEVATRVLLGEGWDKARERVWESTRHVVGDRQWMVDRIVRTEISAVANATTLAALHAEDDDPEDPMLKRLVATWDQVTARDSQMLHGQTKKLGEPFYDAYHGIEYQAPPNRPNDREIIVGWRGDYPEDMPEFVDRTAKPVDGGKAPRRKRKGPEMAKARPVPKPGRKVAATGRLAELDAAARKLEVDLAMREMEIGSMDAQRFVEGQLLGQGPEMLVTLRKHNAAIDARVAALRVEQEVAEQARHRLVAQRKRVEVARAKGGPVTMVAPKAPKPRTIEQREGLGKGPGQTRTRKWPKDKIEIRDDVRAGLSKMIAPEMDPEDRIQALASLASLEPREMEFVKISAQYVDGEPRITITGVTKGGGDVQRELEKRGNAWVLRNELLDLGDRTKFKPGTGTKALARQMDASRRLGIDAVEATASGSPTDKRYNGFYTWPRLGYDGPLSARMKAKLPEDFGSPTLVSELIATPEGRKWWKANGEPFEARFDPRKGSRSMRVLDAYLKEKEL